MTKTAKLSFPIVAKTEKNGDIYVIGKASDGTLDSDGQICDTSWMSMAFKRYFQTGANVRLQHSQRPVGVGVEMHQGDDGSVWLKSMIVDKKAKTLVLKGVLRAYSVGIVRPVIEKDNAAPGGRICGGDLAEVSLVDRPSNPSTYIQLCKSTKNGVVTTGKITKGKKVKKPKVTKLDKAAVASLTETIMDTAASTNSVRKFAMIRMLRTTDSREREMMRELLDSGGL